MPRSSSARSQGAPEVPTRNDPRSSRSMGSTARSTASGSLSNSVDKFKDDNKDSIAVYPVSTSVLSDNTEIELPKRGSWWKKVETSRDVIGVLKTNKRIIPEIVIEEFDAEVLSQEKQNKYTLDVPESSGSSGCTSIGSIDFPQRKLFSNKEKQKKMKLVKLNNTNINEKTVKVEPKKIFGQTSKRPKPVFPSALLNMSLDKTSNTTNEIATEAMGQTKSLFGKRPGTERKKMFADFIESESEEDIEDIQRKHFTFNKHSGPTIRTNAALKGLRDLSQSSNIERNDWNFLPSSTMIEHFSKQPDRSQNEEEIQESDNEADNENDDDALVNRTGSIEAPRFHENSNEMDSFHGNDQNTSVRITKSFLQNFTLKASIATAEDTTGPRDGVPCTSAEGSGWDSHRTTRNTLRQTFGKDTPRKSLKALVLEKSAKRQTVIDEANAKQINNNDDNDKNIAQANLEMYLQKVMQENLERKLKIEQQVKNSLKKNQPSHFDMLNFRVPPKKLTICKAKVVSAPKVKRTKQPLIPLDDLPSELREDMKYKPPKRYKPRDASWVTNRLYTFLETKLEPKYDYRARIRAEKLVETIYNFVRDTKRLKVAPAHSVDELKKEMARLDIVTTHFDFHNFFSDYMPMEVKIKVVPDVINDIPVPEDIFAPILE